MLRSHRRLSDIFTGGYRIVWIGAVGGQVDVAGLVAVQFDERVACRVVRAAADVGAAHLVEAHHGVPRLGSALGETVENRQVLDILARQAGPFIGIDVHLVELNAAGVFQLEARFGGDAHV